MWQYLRGTVIKGLTFSGRSFDMHIFTDSDWAGDVLTRRSTTGYVVFAAGGPIAWQSKLQTTVSLGGVKKDGNFFIGGGRSRLAVNDLGPKREGGKDETQEKQYISIHCGSILMIWNGSLAIGKKIS